MFYIGNSLPKTVPSTLETRLLLYYENILNIA